MGYTIWPNGNAGDAVSEIYSEYQNASDKFPKFNSAHEGFAVLKEEVDELWEEVRAKQGKRDSKNMRKEAIQIGAMAVRFITDICDSDQQGQK